MDLKQRLAGLDSLSGYYDMTPAQLRMYKVLKRQAIQAEYMVDEYLESLLPLEELKQIRETREQREEQVFEAYYDCSIGDGMERDNIENEIQDMNHWEFVQMFGLVRGRYDPDYEDDNGGDMHGRDPFDGGEFDQGKEE